MVVDAGSDPKVADAGADLKGADANSSLATFECLKLSTTALVDTQRCAQCASSTCG